jgi:hypothetical protein
MIRKRFKIVFLCGVLLALLPGCSKTEKLTGPVDSGRGVVLLKISKIAGSIFQKLADSANITVSASDMLTINQKLTVTDTSVEGKIEGIPAGKARLFTLTVFDSLDTLQYRGSATADIFTDSLAHITITIVRVAGAAVINTIINESDSIPKNGLVAYYPFNGNARDESGNVNDGVVNGATLTEDRFKNSRKAYYFNGAHDYIEIPSTPLLNMHNQITISAWINPEMQIAGGIVSKVGGPNGNYGYQFLIADSNSQIHFQFNSDGDPSGGNWNVNNYHSNAEILTGKWNYIAATYDNNTIAIYFNGILIGTKVVGAHVFASSSSSLRISSDCNNNVFFKGSMDDIRIYDRALTEKEIQHLYHESGWTGN